MVTGHAGGWLSLAPRQTGVLLVDEARLADTLRLQQNQCRARAALSQRRRGEGKHFTVVAQQVVGHLFQHRSAVLGTQSLAMHDANAAVSALTSQGKKLPKHGFGDTDTHPVQVDLVLHGVQPALETTQGARRVAIAQEGERIAALHIAELEGARLEIHCRMKFIGNALAW